MKRLVPCLLLLAAACGPTVDDKSTAGLRAGADPAARAIDADTLREVIAEIASDKYEGRGTASRGGELAIDYLSSRLAAIGYRPGGPGGAWRQSVPLLGLTARMPETWVFRAGDREKGFRWRDRYIASSGVQRESVEIRDADVVFVGYGIVAPEVGWDDYKGADLEGKILLMLNNDPDWDPKLFAGERRLFYGRWDYKYDSAARQGALGAIIIHTDKSAGYPWQVVQTSWSGEQFELTAGDEPRIEVKAWLTWDAARDLVALGGGDLEALVGSARSPEFRPVPLGVRTSLAFTNRMNRTESANVLGLLEGSDPGLRNEAVIYTAHHDHLGIGEPDARGDRIYNGAVDNASGVAQVLAIAKAFGRLAEPPRRSILIALVTAEEQGLLGSLFYSLDPTFPPGRIAANINIDGGNIWGRTRDVAIIGRGKSSLEDDLERVASLEGRVVTDEPFPDKGYYYRSDQLSFARIGVPALYFKSGTEFIGRPQDWGRERNEEWIRTNYHQPSDELDESWNLEGMVEDARLAFYVGLLAADAEKMPSWRPGDEFEAARKKAIAAAPASN